MKALLVDDEENNLENLAFLLRHDCQGIDVIGKALNAEEARRFLSQQTVDVIFLDIQMPGETGFQFLQSIAPIHYNVIFVTAYNEFSLQAIKANAIDYILKPIRIEDLQQAISRLAYLLKNQQAAALNQELMQNFLQLNNPNATPKRIALPQLGSVNYLDVDEIVSLQADGNYTIIHKRNMQKLVISKNLKDFEDILDAKQFVRIHKSYIVNLDQVQEYSTTDGGVAKMRDGSEWSISRRQVDVFLAKMNASSLSFKKPH